MYSPNSFSVQIANLCIGISGYNDEDSSCLQELKRIFSHHEVSPDTPVVHRVVVCAPRRFKMVPDASLQWVSPCLGVTGSTPRRLWSFFTRSQVVPKYSGTCDVMCYKDAPRQVGYYVPKNAQWRIEHHADEHITYVYSKKPSDVSDGLSSLLLHVIGSQYGCYLLFASCVAIDGKALLFTGNGGVGKTTLCMELIKQGATYIGDDLVLVYLDGGQPKVGSLLFPVKCYAEGDLSHKKKLDVASQTSQRPPLNVPLKSIYLLRRTEASNAESYLQPLQGGTLFEEMLNLTNKANTHANAQRFVDTMTTICGTVTCGYCYYGKHDKITPSLFENHD